MLCCQFVPFHFVCSLLKSWNAKVLTYSGLFLVLIFINNKSSHFFLLISKRHETTLASTLGWDDGKSPIFNFLSNLIWSWPLLRECIFTVWILALYRRQLDLFQFLEDVSPLIQEAPSVLTNRRGVASYTATPHYLRSSGSPILWWFTQSKASPP